MPQGSDGPDFSALLSSAPAAPQEPAKPQVDFKALLGAAPTPQQEQQIEVPDARFPGVSGPTSMGDAAAGLATGVAKGVLGMLGFVADATGSKQLGNKVARTVEAVNKQLETADTGGKIFAGLGEAAPALAGGEAISALKFGSKLPAIVKVLGGGAAAGATAPQDASTPEERNQSREVGAAEGALLSGGIGAGIGVGTKLTQKVIASRKLAGILDEVRNTFEDFKPTGEQVAAAVKPSVEGTAQKYRTSIRALQREVTSSGGVDTKPILDAVGEAGPRPTDSKSPSGKMLVYVRDQLEPYKPNAAGIDEKVAKEFAALPKPVLQQIEKQTGKKLLPTPGANGDLLHLKELRKKIDAHLESLEPGAEKDADVGKLRQIRDSIDEQTRSFLQNNKKAGTLYKSMSPGYETMVKQGQQPEIAGLLSADPETRVNTILSTVKQGTTKQMQNMARFLGPPGSEAHKDLFHVVMHDAFLDSIDKKTGEVDGGKFANYFLDPKVKENLSFIRTPHQQDMIKGMQNLIQFQKTGKVAEGGHDLFNIGRYVFPGYMLARGIEHGTHALLSGHGMAAAAIPIASSVVGAGVMVGGSRYVDNLLTKKLGRNFLIAASKAKPDSPEMMKIVDSFSRRLSAATGVLAAQRGGTPSNN